MEGFGRVEMRRTLLLAMLVLAVFDTRCVPPRTGIDKEAAFAEGDSLDANYALIRDNTAPLAPEIIRLYGVMAKYISRDSTPIAIYRSQEPLPFKVEGYLDCAVNGMLWYQIDTVLQSLYPGLSVVARNQIGDSIEKQRGAPSDCHILVASELQGFSTASSARRTVVFERSAFVSGRNVLIAAARLFEVMDSSYPLSGDEFYYVFIFDTSGKVLRWLRLPVIYN
jgi:hypothetical protein